MHHWRPKRLHACNSHARRACVITPETQPESLSRAHGPTHHNAVPPVPHETGCVGTAAFCAFAVIVQQVLLYESVST